MFFPAAVNTYRVQTAGFANIFYDFILVIFNCRSINSKGTKILPVLMEDIDRNGFFVLIGGT
jgi:hypothetical protein